MRSESAYDSYHFSASETLNFLNEKLEEALNAENVNRYTYLYRQLELSFNYSRSEACLFQWECVADYLVETDYPPILKCLEMITGRLSAPPSMDMDVIRRGETVMRLLYSLSHLIQEHDQSKQLECAVIPVILSYVNPQNLGVGQAIETLQKFVEDRPDSLDVSADFVLQFCF